MRKLTLTIAAATLMTAGTAIAAPGMGGKGMPRGDMTRTQVEAMAAERFAKMDANDDGQLDKADREAMRAKMFDRIDANRDGSISRDEFAAMHRGRGPMAEGGAPGERDGMAGHHRAGGKMGGKRGHRMGGMAMARMADTNNDGAISRAEFTAAALKRFDTADADRNGTVTDAERTAARAAMKTAWQAKAQERRAARQTN